MYKVPPPELVQSMYEHWIATGDSYKKLKEKFGISEVTIAKRIHEKLTKTPIQAAETKEHKYQRYYDYWQSRTKEAYNYLIAEELGIWEGTLKRAVNYINNKKHGQ